VQNGLPDLPDLLDSWLVILRAQHKSEYTLRNYRAAVTSFLNFCTETGLACELTKANVIAWVASQAGQEASTMRLRLISLKLFCRWLADEEGLDTTAVLTVKPPKMDQPSVPDLSEDELRRMLKACDGSELRDKRDKAMVILAAETGLRAAELLGLEVGDIDVGACVVHVRRGKGGKGRRVHFSAGAAAALDRYLRARKAAGWPRAEGSVWVSRVGPLSYPGAVTTLKRRAADAGVNGFHLHRLRHTAAVRWLRSGGSETGLRAHAGWTSNTMIDRYTKAASEQLAAEEFDRLDLGLE
jgi:site-specific recombinase XerD